MELFPNGLANHAKNFTTGKALFLTRQVISMVAKFGGRKQKKIINRNFGFVAEKVWIHKYPFLTHMLFTQKL